MIENKSMGVDTLAKSCDDFDKIRGDCKASDELQHFVFNEDKDDVTFNDDVENVSVDVANGSNNVKQGSGSLHISTNIDPKSIDQSGSDEIIWSIKKSPTNVCSTESPLKLSFKKSPPPLKLSIRKPPSGKGTKGEGEASPIRLSIKKSPSLSSSGITGI